MYTDKIDKERVQKTKRSKKVDTDVTEEEMEKNIENAIDILDEYIDQSRESTSSVSQNHQKKCTFYKKQQQIQTQSWPEFFFLKYDKKTRELNKSILRSCLFDIFPKKWLHILLFLEFFA